MKIIAIANFENLATARLPQKLFSLTIIFIVVVVIGWKLKNSAQLTKTDALALQQQQLSQQIKKSINALSLKTARQKFSDPQSSYNKLMQTIPNQQILPLLLTDISKLGNKLGLAIIVFKPQAEIKHKFYLELPIEFSAMGTYSQIQNFILELGKLHSPLLCSKFNLRPATKNEIQQGNIIEKFQQNPLVFKAIIKLYYHATTYKIVKPLDAKLTPHDKLIDPFLPTNSPPVNINTTQQKTLLAAYELSLLQMVGTIKNNHTLWALIAAPNGLIYPAAVGQFLGKSHAKIIKISSVAITLNIQTRVNNKWQTQLQTLTLLTAPKLI